MSTIMHSHEYLTQLEEKKARLGHLLNEFGNHELVVIPSKETGYRMRAEFRVWHEGDDLFHHRAFALFDHIVLREAKCVMFGGAALMNILTNALVFLDCAFLRLKLRAVQIDFHLEIVGRGESRRRGDGSGNGDGCD